MMVSILFEPSQFYSYAVKAIKGTIAEKSLFVIIINMESD
jgi:hypothetical protein